MRRRRAIHAGTASQTTTRSAMSAITISEPARLSSCAGRPAVTLIARTPAHETSRNVHATKTAPRTTRRRRDLPGRVFIVKVSQFSDKCPLRVREARRQADTERRRTVRDRRVSLVLTGPEVDVRAGTAGVDDEVLVRGWDRPVERAANALPSARVTGWPTPTFASGGPAIRRGATWR